MELFLGYAALLIVGALLGITGTGGSMLAIPVLVYMFSVDIVVASAYSMLMVGLTSLAGSVLKLRRQLIDARTGLTFGVPSVIATFITRKWLIVEVPEPVLRLDSFILEKDQALLLLLSVLMIGSSLMIIHRSRLTEVNGKFEVLPLTVSGFGVGLVAGLVGAGGGVLILPALIFFGQLPFRKAVGTTLFIIACNSLTGVCGDLLNYSLDWYFALSFSAVALTGLIAGSLAEKYFLRDQHLHKYFAWFTLAIAAGILAKALI